MENNYEIIENFIELFQHPDIKVKLYIINELFNGDFNDSEKADFIDKVLSSNYTSPADKVKLQSKIISELFKSNIKIDEQLLRTLLRLLCISHNIKLVDSIIDYLKTFDKKILLPVIKDILSNFIIELHKNIFFLLSNIEGIESFNIILDSLCHESNSENSSFFRDIFKKKVAFINENEMDKTPYINTCYEQIKKIDNMSNRFFIIQQSIKFGAQSITYFKSFYENSVYKDEIIKSISKIDKKDLFNTFISTLENCNDKDEKDIFLFIIDIFSKIFPDKIYDLIIKHPNCIKGSDEMIDTLAQCNNIDLICRLLINNNPEIANIGLKLARNTENNRIFELTKKLIKNTDEDVRMNSLIVLSKYPLYEVLPIYREMLSDPSENVQNTSLSILSRYKDEKVNSLLIEELNNESIREKIINILGERNLEYYLNNFQQLNEEAKKNMAKALSKTSDTLISESLERCKSHDVENRFMGVKTLSYILPDKQDIILAQFKKMINDPDSFIRSTIATSLKDIISPVATIILLNLLKDPNKRVRANCIESFLNTTNKSSIIKALKNFLNDPNNRIRGNAIIVLFKLGYKESVKEIEKMFRMEDKWMKVTAIYVAGELKINSFSYEIIPYLNSKDKDLRKNALKAMIKINSSKFIPHIKRLLNDLDSEIRDIASNYLKNLRN